MTTTIVDRAAKLVTDVAADAALKEKREEGARFIRQAQRALSTAQAAVVRVQRGLQLDKENAKALEAAVAALSKAPALDRVSVPHSTLIGGGVMNDPLSGAVLLSLLGEACKVAQRAASGGSLASAEAAVVSATADLEKVSRKFAS